MIRWGLGSGFIMAQMIVMIVAEAVTFGFSGGATRLEFIPLFWMSLPYSIPIGIIPGVILGMLGALKLQNGLKKMPPHLIPEYIYVIHRELVEGTFVAILFVGMVLSIFAGITIAEVVLFLCLFLSLIFAATTAYATHRYLVRLQRYYEQVSKEKRKGKPKQAMNLLLDAEDADELISVEAVEDSVQRQEET